MKNEKEKGLVQIYTGNGKGKTTAALGQAFRALGHGFKIIMIQFLKGAWNYGELETARSLSDRFEIIQMGGGFTWEEKTPGQNSDLAKRAWEFSKDKIMSGSYQMVILDELNYALDYSYITSQEVIEVLRRRPENTHIVITGRAAPKELLEFADLVTEMRAIKHPFQLGIKAQKGIEY